MAQWLVTRRGGGLPADPEQAEGCVVVTLWKKAQWPATHVRDGDGVYVFDSRARRTLFGGTVDRLVTATYTDLDGAEATLRDQFPDSPQPSLPSSAPVSGWLIAFTLTAVEWIDKGPVDIRLPTLRGGRMGWVDLDAVPPTIVTALGIREA